MVGSAVAGAALVWSGRRARTCQVSSGEERVFRAVNDAPESLHAPVWAVMQAGSLGAVYAAAGLVARRSTAPVTPTVVALAGTVVWGGVKLVKPHVGRGRPEHHLADVRVRGGRQSGLGFPSGHAAVATTLARIAFCAGGARAAALGVAAVTGLGRMYVGAHLPLDLIGGHAIGALASETVLALARR